jgi:glutaredoxin 2
MKFEVIDFQDIQPEEAKKDWKGQKAKDVQRLIDAVATDDQDLQDIETKLEDIDDLTEDEKEDEQRLYRRSREVR